jgi:hypothetical protein
MEPAFPAVLSDGEPLVTFGPVPLAEVIPPPEIAAEPAPPPAHQLVTGCATAPRAGL